MNALKDNLDRAASVAGEKLRETSQRVREGATEAYGAARERAGQAYSTAKTQASRTGERAQSLIEENPLGVLAGGLAVGALIGALLPRARMEGDLLDGLGTKLGDASREQLDKLGLTQENARAKVSKIIDTAVGAIGKKD